MAAEPVGGAFLSSFLNVLFHRLSDPEIINLIRGKKLSEKIIRRFKAILYAAEALLNDAERRQIREGPVKVWLDDLKDALYEANDFLDEIATKAATHKDPVMDHTLDQCFRGREQEASCEVVWKTNKHFKSTYLS